MKGLLAVLMLGAAVANPSAQTPAPTPAQTPAQTPAKAPVKAPAPRPAATAAKPTSVRVSVKDPDGASLTGVHLQLSGAGASGEFVTGAAGTAIVPIPKPGTFRLHCELDGFVTLEREFSVGNGAWNPVEVVLNAAPPPPPPPPPAKPVEAKAAPMPSSGPPLAMSIPDFVDKNFIGRDPMKESILACKPRETVRLLQMRDSLATHVHDGVDEIIYVVAGDGSMKIGNDESPIHAGSLVFVPNGDNHSIGRKGKNPLIVISTLVGTSCDSAKSTR
jgi:Cupin domain